MRDVTGTGKYAGAVTLVARHGKIVEWQAYGQRDLAEASVMQPTSIFRIYSMTKTMTSVAVLMLMEEGRLTLEDPIGRYLPQLAGAHVLVAGTSAAPHVQPASRPITIRHLLTHTAGFPTSGKDPPELRETLKRAEVAKSSSLADFVSRLSRVPLAAEPGTRFSYDGVNTEVLARLVEVVSGMSFDVFLERRLFAPLRLVDTGFSVPAEKRARLAELYTTDAAGRLVKFADREAGSLAGGMSRRYPSGAGGLYSTAGDFARFAQMLLNGGELEGVVILGRKTVELMMMNHLSHLDPPVNEFSDSEGFGLGGYVVLDVAGRGRPGSPGQFGWSGSAGTYYTIDPREQLIAILMTQHLHQGLPNDPEKLSARFYNLVYQSLLN